MQNVVRILQQSRLCRNMTEEEIDELLKDYRCQIKEVRKKETVLEELDCPDSIYVLLSGEVLIAKDTPGGKRMILTKLDKPGTLFGEIYAFMELKQYEMYVQALCDSRVLVISYTLFADENGSRLAGILRENMLHIFAEKAYDLNRRLRVLSGASLREKIAHFLLERQDEDGIIRMTLSREEMADYLNVTRPSLSRELGNMDKEGILSIEGRSIVILNQDALENYL